MVTKFILLLLVLLKITSADPLPDPDIQVHIQQQVNIDTNTGCGRGCCLRDNTLCSSMYGYCQRPNDQCLGMSINNKTLGEKYCESSGNPYCSCCAPSGQVFTADIENALSHAIRNTILFTRNSCQNEKNETICANCTLTEFNEASTSAMKEFLNITLKYLKTPKHIQNHTYGFIEKFYNAIKDHETIPGGDWLLNTTNDIQNNQSNQEQVFISPSDHPYVSCHNIYQSIISQSFPDFWLYTCGLWNIFHTLTVSAQKSGHPLEVLEAIKNYVIYFHGCSDCEGHLWGMYNQTLRDDPSTVETPDKAIIWLWCIHNTVNQRFTGKGLEYDADLKYLWPPHPQFPVPSACPHCWADKDNLGYCPDCEYTNCAELFCDGIPDGNDNDNDKGTCFRLEDDPPVYYYNFSIPAILSYLKSTYGGPYSYLNTNDEWYPLELKDGTLCPGPTDPCPSDSIPDIPLEC